MLFSVLFNLVSNAKKYTDIESRDDDLDLDVHLRIRRCNESIIEFLIDDAGCGLSSEFLADASPLFEQGFRSLPKGSSIPGGGNGLFFTRLLVEQVLQGRLTPAIG